MKAIARLLDARTGRVLYETEVEAELRKPPRVRAPDERGEGPRALTLALLKEESARRRVHRARARRAQARYEELPTTSRLLALMRAQEASRGSRIRARRLQEGWAELRRRS